MARTPNLVLRGEVFYWRGRLFCALDACQKSSQIKISLHTKDRVRATRMARRLTLLRDETIAGTSGMIKPDILQAIMERERDAMLDHLDMLAAGPHRTGHANDIGQVESDLIVGWAYRLVEIFGARHKVDGEGGHELAAWLADNGAPARLVEKIVAHYPEVRQEYQPGPKRKEIDQLFEEFGLENNPVAHQSPGSGLID